MLFTLALSAVAVAVATATPADACMQFRITRSDAAVIGVVGTLTLPLWIVPAIGYGIVAGVEAAKESIEERKAESPDKKLCAKNGEWWRQRASKAQLQPLLNEAETNPSPTTLLRLGVAMFQADDLMAARQYLRRSVEMARADLIQAKQKSGDDAATAAAGAGAGATLAQLAVALWTLGSIKLRMMIWKDAAEHFSEAIGVLDEMQNEKKERSGGGGGDDDGATTTTTTTKVQPDSIGAATAAATAEGAVVLDKAPILSNLGWALLHVALYDTDTGDSGEAEIDAEIAKLTAAAVEKLEQAQALQPNESDFLLRLAIARYYQAHQAPPPHATPPMEFVACMRECAQMFHAVAQSTGFDDDARAAAQAYEGQCHFSLALYDPNQEEAHRAAHIAAGDAATVQARTTSSDGMFETHIPPGTLSSDNLPGEADYWKQNLAQPWRLVPPELNCGTKPHTFQKRRFHRPSWCAKCQQHITLKQNYADEGVFECTACKGRYHHACRQSIGDDQMCPAEVSSQREIDQHQHIMRDKTLHRPTWCGSCTKFIWNVKGALRCDACHLVVHKDCVSFVRNALLAPESPKKE